MNTIMLNVVVVNWQIRKAKPAEITIYIIVIGRFVTAMRSEFLRSCLNVSWNQASSGKEQKEEATIMIRKKQGKKAVHWNCASSMVRIMQTSNTKNAARAMQRNCNPVALRKFSLKHLKQSFSIAGLSPARIAIVILYKDVTAAPIVKIGMQLSIKIRLTIIRLAILVRNRVPALLGLKNDEGILISNQFYIINKRHNNILNHTERIFAFCTSGKLKPCRKRQAILKNLCNLTFRKAKNVQNSQKKQEMYTYGQIVARNVEKRIASLTKIYTVEGRKGPEQIH